MENTAESVVVVEENETVVETTEMCTEETVDVVEPLELVVAESIEDTEGDASGFNPTKDSETSSKAPAEIIGGSTKTAEGTNQGETSTEEETETEVGVEFAADVAVTKEETLNRVYGGIVPTGGENDQEDSSENVDCEAGEVTVKNYEEPSDEVDGETEEVTVEVIAQRTGIIGGAIEEEPLEKVDGEADEAAIEAAEVESPDEVGDETEVSDEDAEEAIEDTLHRIGGRVELAEEVAGTIDQRTGEQFLRFLNSSRHFFKDGLVPKLKRLASPRNLWELSKKPAKRIYSSGWTMK